MAENSIAFLRTPKEPSGAVILLANEKETDRILTLLEPDACMIAAVCGTITEEEIPSVMGKILTEFQNRGADFTRIYLIGCESLSETAWKIIGRYSRVLAGCCVEGGAEHLVSVREAKFLPVLAVRGTREEHFSAAQLIRILRTEGSEQADFLEKTVWIDQTMMDWLFRQTKEAQYEVHWIKPGLWSIEAGAIESFYLIEGNDKALVIDTGLNPGKIMPLIRSLTKLPVALALTHAHGDHMLHVEEFDEVYCSPREAQMPPEFLQAMMPGVSIDFSRYTPLEEGDVLDLGGVSIEVFAGYGHTPGSLVFVDHTHHCLFSGDAFGSGIGVLMAIPGTLKVSDLLVSVKRFLTHQQQLKDYIWYGGHRCQEFAEQKRGEYYNPLCFEVLEDFVVLCEKLLNHDPSLSFEPGSNHWLSETVYTVSYQKASMWVTESRIC